MTHTLLPIGIYYEHPDWFRPLFAELDRRGIPYSKINAASHFYDPASRTEASEYSLVFNRMSPSAYLRGGANSLFYTKGYLAHLERCGVPVVNGTKAYGNETSKAEQILLLESLHLDYPKSIVINRASLAPVAAESLRFPIVIKANIGGSGAGIVRFETLDALRNGAANDEIDLGIDGTALVQEYTPARGGFITRIETLGGKYLYGINVHTDGSSFNLCPADICQTSGGVALSRNACPVDAPQSGMTVESITPPTEVITAVERIVQAAGIDVGGVEFMIDDRDGRLVYYDINALSNFVADARRVIGFDPHERLVDFLIQKAKT